MERTLSRNLAEQVGKPVLLQGWIQARRDHGKLLFLDLRDRTGLTQVVVLPNSNAAKVASDLKSEYVVAIEGMVNLRPEKMINPDLPSGTVEVAADTITILNVAKTPPFELDDTSGVKEEVRLQYRYLDLRSPRMQRNLKLRSAVTDYIRRFLADREFVEVDTPILTKSTPEGARDFLVPSRLRAGQFYALPQSPQQYKQLLMVAGLERYFQIARCFRDEDPRADRAYGEFTQLDLEMSFTTQEDILILTEELFSTMVQKIFPRKRMSQTPWPRLTYQEAMEVHGTDSPDLRKEKDNPDELAFVWVVDFPLFAQQTKEDFFHGSGSAKFAPSHHMFTAPHPEDVKHLEDNPLKVRGLQHDLVLNGHEVGGGSIRIHDAKIQEKVFELIGFSEDQIAQFAHILEAFEYGVPPHGGIAPGIDRLLMTILGEPSVRELIAFPMTSGGQTAVMNAPSVVSPTQLKELGIDVVKTT